MSGKRITLKDIASILGCSRTTVSKGLRNHPEIPKETCERVQEVATKLGYEPNAYAAALANFKQPVSAAQSASIGVLLGHAEGNPIKRGIYDGWIGGIRAAAAKRGCSVEVFWALEPGMTAEKMESILFARNIKGVVLLAMHADELALDWSRLSCVYLVQSREPLQFDHFSLDYYKTIADGVESLHNAGFKRVGLALLSIYASRGRGQMEAAFRYFYKGRMELEQSIFLYDSSLESFVTWLQTYRPDAILTWRFPQMRDLLDQHFKSKSIRPVVLDFGLDVQQPEKELGAAALDHLINHIYQSVRGYQDYPKSIRLSASLESISFSDSTVL